MMVSVGNAFDSLASSGLSQAMHPVHTAQQSSVVFLLACCVNLHFVLLPIPIFNDSKLHWLFTDLNMLASGGLLMGTRCSFIFG
jgi:hypothetical protein